MKRVLLLLLVLTVGCIHKTGGAVTPMERVTTDNAVFAQLNDSIEQGAESVATAGLLKPAQVAPVIGWCGQVAVAHEQITAILNAGTVTTANVASIQALVTQIQQSATSLIASGTLGVKNPKTQQSISADIQAASSLAGSLLNEISILKVTQ
jgi:hypothetical protein